MYQNAVSRKQLTPANRALEQLWGFCGFKVDQKDITVRENPIAKLMRLIDGKTRGLPTEQERMH